MKTTSDIAKAIRNLRVSASATLDERIHTAIAATTSRPAPPSERELSLMQILNLLMKEKTTRFAFGTLAVTAMLVAAILKTSTATAWSMDDTIAALRKYRGIFMVGRGLGKTPDSVFMVWGRANPSGTASEACLLIADDNQVWAKDNVTHYYSSAEKKVLVDHATTAFITPWFGPKLFGMMSKASDREARRDTDPVTGENRVSLTCSLHNAQGLQSWKIEFDPKTKLPTRLKQWNNLKRQGKPVFEAERILYLEDVSEEIFAVHVPADVEFAEKPLEIPEANLALLADPKTGIAVEGLSRDAASQKIVGEMWTAVIGNDLARLRELCPILAGWKDEVVHELLAQDEPVEVLKLGNIEKEGASRLGPIALVPSQVRCKDGRRLEVKMLVQFRDLGGAKACVVHGPYGIPYELPAKPEK